MRVFVFSSLLVLALTGCKPFWNPTFMPSGYKHHENTYKSPPGPEARDIGYDYSAEENAAVIDNWSDAVADIVLRAKAHDIRPAGPIYLMTNMGQSASQATFDLALREELRSMGHTLVRDVAAGTPLFYAAVKEPLEEGAPEGAVPYTELTLALLNSEGEIAQSVSNLYEVPLHGVRSIGLPFHSKSSNEPMTMQEESVRDDYNE